MGPEGLDELLRQRVEEQPPASDRLAAVVAGGTRRQRRRRAAAVGPLALAVLAGSIAVLGLATDDDDRSELLATGGGDGEHSGSIDGADVGADVRCPGSTERRIDGGRQPGADALPALDEAATRQDATLVLAQIEDSLRAEFPGATISVTEGFGWAWSGVNGGDHTVVEADDFAILVRLPAASACPTASDLHRFSEGVPVFFAFRPSAASSTGTEVTATGPVSPPLAIERVEVRVPAPGVEEVTIVLDGLISGSSIRRVDDIGAAAVDGVDGVAYTVQPASAVVVCDATHDFGDEDEPGSVDVLLPAAWFASADPMEPPVEYVGSADETEAKVPVCVADEFVQVSIWGADPIGDEPVAVVDVDGATHIVATVRR